MSISPEKNDVNISALFSWGKEVTISGSDGKDLTFYVRLVGDADLNKARIFALRKSAELRRTLRNLDSEERMAFIVDYESLDVEKLIEMIVYMNMRNITMKVIDKVEVPFPKDLDDDATLEEQENYQMELDAWPRKREAKIREEIEKEVVKFRGTLEGQSKERLYKQYEDSAISEMCESEMTKQYRQMCTFLGLYADEKYKERLFQNFETFDNLPTEAKQIFLDNYISLELSMDELKK